MLKNAEVINQKIKDFLRKTVFFSETQKNFVFSDLICSEIKRTRFIIWKTIIWPTCPKKEKNIVFQVLNILFLH